MAACGHLRVQLLIKLINLVKEQWLPMRASTRAIFTTSTAGQPAFDAGQPTPETHPELLSSGEIMPGITAADFALRRRNLMHQLPKESLVIMSSATVKQMTDVVPYPFRQHADYLYYTGCHQPGGIAVLGDQADLCMFMPDPICEREVWDGHVAGIFEALNVFKADQAFSLNQLPKVLPRMIEQAKAIYHDSTGEYKVYEGIPEFQEALREGKVHNVQQFTHEARWIKSDREINLMRQSAAITSQAFLRTMKYSKTWPHEHILAATVEYECKVRGAQRMAFPPVVGGGINGTIIHYSRNDQWVRKGEMVLMDAGCEYYGYVSDMTRTWPPGGTFSDVQREVYEIVLSTMKDCFRLCHPGGTLRKIHDHSAYLLSKALTKIGLIEGFSQERGLQTLQAQKYLMFNPTAIGHYLGMDVHDCASVSASRKLEPGVVITIEPGIYIPVRDDIPERFRGIGVRIEDEVLITDSGYEVLSASIPKEIHEIEAWLQL